MPSEKIPLFVDLKGINNKVDPTRLLYKTDHGYQLLQYADNCMIDETGRIERRPGYTEVLSLSNCHSLWSNKTMTLFGSGTSLYRLNSDDTATVIRTGLQNNAPISFTEVAGFIFYVNGYQKGDWSQHNSFSTWELKAPTQRVANRSYIEVPIGTKLAYYNGRIYVAVENVVYYTEPFAYYCIDPAQNFYIFDDIITAIQPTEGGIYFGTAEQTIFIQNPGSKESQQITYSTGIIDGTNLSIEGSTLGRDGIYGRCGIWLGADGIYLGTPNGTVVNLTNDNLSLPELSKGTAFIHDGYYIILAE